MVTREQLEERRVLIAASPDLQALQQRLVERAEPVLKKMPPVPKVKALLSRDGGTCPKDGTALAFDPWSPDAHRCPSCGEMVRGERHDRHWAKFQHLWLSERAAHLATVAALANHDAAGEQAARILGAYQPLYFELPNRDNVLGPTHLFFSTYLESLWILNYLAAATLLRESDRMPEDLSATVDAIADEAASVIGDFNEGLSNRQTWHAAALTAIAAWFGDEDLARSSIEERTGLMGHLADGFGDDGTWYEGENYHLFALRGLLTGLGWAASLGAHLLEDEDVAGHLRAALLAPALTALPDFTFPARKDSRFGVSLAQPMHLETWEVGRGLLGGGEPGALESWLAALYQAPAQPALPLESYLHEAGETAPVHRGRGDHSWWSLLFMPAELQASEPWTPSGRHFPTQGLAILRQGDRYASLECGKPGGGHGHPDRLHLALHAGGVHWLPDFGTGSYVSPDLFWYRSTLAHNAPLLDGHSQPYEGGDCEMFQQEGDWGWMRGRFREFDRTVVAGPEYLLDILTYSDTMTHRLDLPWHLAGESMVETPGRWERIAADSVAGEFVREAEQFIPETAGGFIIRSAAGGRGCRLHLRFDGDLLRARAPGPPGTGEQVFYLARATAASSRMVTVIDTSPDARITGLSLEGDVVTVEHGGTDRHTPLLEGWQVERGDTVIKLAGVQRRMLEPEPIFTRPGTDRPAATAAWVSEPPALDGSDEGFDLSEPITLDTELQYRRSEEPYADADYFSATAWVNWCDDDLFLLAEVKKEDIVLRAATSAPLGLDNEVDDIHSDGLQLYLKQDDRVLGFLVIPDPGSGDVRVALASPYAGDAAMVTGAWAETPEGYRVTLAIKPGWVMDDRVPLEFDLLVNEMRPGRQRRAGQLVWSGGAGWVYLRGDRQDPARFGLLRLAT